MPLSDLSSSFQNYLKAIWSLQEWTDEPVTASAIAARVQVRLSSTSDAVRKLAALGLVRHAPYGAITLTPLGRRYAIEMVRRHRLLESYLVWQLGYTWDEVHDEAEALEHAVSDLFIERIDAALGHPVRDPHGDPIPSPDGTLPDLEAVALSEIAFDTPVRVERIADDDAAALRHLGTNGVGVGTVLTVQPGPPYSGSVQLLVEGHDPLPLGQPLLESIFVSLAR
ncbi:MAG: metal-dependent transcriptional regulator [Buchananella hordeovulneris]|nr:metal-dependent transcriptional regulator [Buchananella hordeovulneris]